MNKELPKVYEPQQVESRIYQMSVSYTHLTLPTTMLV